MQVILLDKMGSLGDVGDQVKVRPGYARNYLVPQGKAVPATPENIAHFEKRRAELEQQAAAKLEQAQQRAQELEQAGLITVAVQVDEGGNPYGSVGSREIVEAFKTANVTVDKSEVLLPSGPLKEVGEHIIQLRVHSDLDIPVTVAVVPA